MTIFSPPHETIAGVSEDLRAGATTCWDVLEACLAKIDEYEPRVRAWVLVDREMARAQARALDAELAEQRWRGPLHGIPIGIKDIVDVAGWPTVAGALHTVEHVANEDAVIVASLRAAGAVFVGKTVTTQYAFFDPPVTRNPWNLERTPGGSSSGSAAAVACGMCLGAIGSQTGGSITRPASFCGVAGLKPTYGRLSLRGILPLAPSLDHPGPIARTVRDLELMWEAISDPDTAARAPGPPRLGRLRGLFEDRAQPDVRASLDRALESFAAKGAAVIESTLPPGFEDVLASHRSIMASEAADWHQRAFSEHRTDYLPRISELIEEGLITPAPRYIRCRQHQERLKDEILACFEGVDALATPATTSAAPDLSTTGDPAFNSPWSYTGLPVISFPIGLSPDGLPLAIQLVGRPRGERNLFGAALWCQEVILTDAHSHDRTRHRLLSSR